MYGDYKTRGERLRTGLFRRRGARRVTRFILGGLGAFMLLDLAGFIAWGLSGQVPPESGYYLGKLSVEIIKIIIQ